MGNNKQTQHVKVRLKTGETLWVELGTDFARIDNIPVTTSEYAYNDLVLLVEGTDGVLEVAERIKPSGYQAGVFLAPKGEPKALKFLTKLEGVALTERINVNECVITAKGKDWEKVLRLAEMLEK